MTRQLYLDLDGVFADFDLGVLHKAGKLPKELDDAAMWKLLCETPQFYRGLRPMPGADRLWLAFSPHKPIFLSGVPLPVDWMRFAPQDKAWWLNYSRFYAPLITCLSKDKATFCKPGDVLLDDRDHYAQNWRDAGGVFITHDPKDITRSLLLVQEAMLAVTN